MLHAVFLAPTGELSNPKVLVEVAVAAEENGWDGVFIWDHVLRPTGEPQAIADPWVALAAIATATERVRIGPMVTPITRRRPIKVAREALSLDHLSDGRLTIGLGLGVDTSGELSKLGEVVDAKERGQRLDEGADLLTQLWSGERVDFEGKHFVARDVTVEPRPVQQPRIPLWFAARGQAMKPVRRAARHEGLFPVDVGADQLAQMIEAVAHERGGLDGFDVACRPNPSLEYGDFERLGVTWALSTDRPGMTRAEALTIAATDPSEVLEQT
ncbi:MAG: LLM class flavin-dependent oxidoreductase [Acidimicrobiales bacterium]